MAKYGEGINHAKTRDPSAANIVDPGLLGGKVRVMQDYATVTAGADLSSAGYIVLGGKLPTGSQVVRVVVGGTMEVFATSSNVHVGDEGDANRYLNNVSCHSNLVRVGPNVAGGMYYTVTGVTDNYVRITIPTGSAISSGTLKLSVFYTVE